MSKKTIKAWAVWSPTKGIREANKIKKLSRSVAACLAEDKHQGVTDWKAAPCTITIHTPKEKKQ